MIFVTVGAQVPFDRLVRAVDEWASSRVSHKIFAQIGASDFYPKSIEWKHFIDPLEFRQRVEAASLIVSHAGMGTILTALEFGKPIIVMPRRGALKETRNDHQIATANYLLAQGRVRVAFDERELIRKLDELEVPHANGQISAYASAELIAAIRDFIEGSISAVDG